MSLLIGNMKAVAFFYPVEKKAGQVSKSSSRKYRVIIIPLPPQRSHKSKGRSSTSLLLHRAKENSGVKPHVDGPEERHLQEAQLLF